MIDPNPPPAPSTDEPNPLFLPRGSVRALMALAVLGVTLGMWATGRAVGQAQEIVTSGVVATYFVIRSLPAVMGGKQ